MVESIKWNYKPNRIQNGFSLDPILSYLKSINNPNAKIPFPIHIVGTNGKGSTTAFFNAILNDAGYKVNTYTSPNLVHLNERIKISDAEILDDELIYEMEQIPQNISFFEALTVVAFKKFAQSGADISLIEAGLGGRFDATNVINPKLCVLTSVSFDHTEYLGNSITQIAKEKLAVQKNAPFVISKQPFKEIYDLTYGLDNAIIFERDFKIINKKNSFIYQSKFNTWEFKNPALKGGHQIENAASVIAGIEILINKYQFNISYENIQNGLQKARWRGRFEEITTGKVRQNFKDIKIFIDGAHNESGIENILKEIANIKSEVHIICGFLKRKNLEKIIPKFINTQNIHITEIHSSEESYTKEELNQKFQEHQIKIHSINNYFFEAFEKINKNSIVIIIGSLYLIGEFLKWNEAKS